MRGNQVATYQGLVAVTQFFLLVLYGLLVEGDFGTAFMYLVLYWLPAVIYHALSGLPMLFAMGSLTKGLLLLSAPFILSMVGNEVIAPVGQDLFRLIIIASFLMNTLYWYLLSKMHLSKKEVTHNS